MFKLVGKGAQGFQFLVAGKDPREDLTWAVFGCQEWNHTWRLNNSELSMRGREVVQMLEAPTRSVRVCAGGSDPEREGEWGRVRARRREWPAWVGSCPARGGPIHGGG